VTLISKRLAPVLIGVVLAAAGCARPKSPQPRPGDPNVLTVYVACAFAPAIEAIGGKFDAANEGKSVRVEGGEPEALVKKIESGAMPDVLVLLGDAEFGLLEREGLMDASRRKGVGAFEVVLATPASKPAVSDASALTSGRVKSITMPAGGTTSLGTEAEHTLARLGVWKKIQNKLVIRPRQSDAMAALAKGDADVGVMYNPCPYMKLEGKVPPGSVKAGPQLSPSPARTIQLEMGVHKKSPRAALAEKFIAFASSGGAQVDPAAGSAAAGDAPPEAGD
jgi:molybdate transport system substrate-binding protein